MLDSKTITHVFHTSLLTTLLFIAAVLLFASASGNAARRSKIIAIAVITSLFIGYWTVTAFKPCYTLTTGSVHKVSNWQDNYSVTETSMVCR